MLVLVMKISLFCYLRRISVSGGGGVAEFVVESRQCYNLVYRFD